MKRPLRASVCLVAAVMVMPFSLARGQDPSPGTGGYDDTARFLAGLPPKADGLLIELSKEIWWQRHAGVWDKAWEGLEKRQISKVREWARTNIPDASAAKGTMFYMFSGPDFLYADAIYPEADRYVFCGIEPVGPVPDMAKLRRDQVPGALNSLRSSMDSVLSFSFFLTKEMKEDFRNHTLPGALPVLSVFLERTGKTIHDVCFVGLDKEGAVSPIPEPVRGGEITAPGVKITFTAAGSDRPRTLYYFSTDISDSGLKETGFLKFCQGIAPGNSLVKSASYLMHESYFSSIRGFLLESSNTLVQDDSGIPCAHFGPEQWQLSLYGSYPGPISLFKNKYQSQLTRLYREGNPVPLEFGIGYRHRKGESTLMVATKKKAEAKPVEEVKPEVTQLPPKAVPVAIPVDESSLAPLGDAMPAP